jgi:hypothetical protein
MGETRKKLMYFTKAEFVGAVELKIAQKEGERDEKRRIRRERPPGIP